VKLILSEAFREELREEFLYLRKKNPAAARVVRDRIIAAIQRLKNYPESGRAWRIPCSRELVIPGLPYIVIYTVSPEAVIVVSLLHSSREVPHVH
jgi:addiction module RelE/StbE family toxin